VLSAFVAKPHVGLVIRKIAFALIYFYSFRQIPLYDAINLPLMKLF
jgi:hypothetical protein